RSPSPAPIVYRTLSSAGSEHRPYKAGVAGSNPAASTHRERFPPHDVQTPSMIIAIASTRGPKVDAVKKVVRSIGRYLGPPSSTPRYLMSAIGGDVSMPRTLEQLLGGARERAMRLQALLRSEKKAADFYIGLEGGFHAIR